MTTRLQEQAGDQLSFRNEAYSERRDLYEQLRASRALHALDVELAKFLDPEWGPLAYLTSQISRGARQSHSALKWADLITSFEDQRRGALQRVWMELHHLAAVPDSHEAWIKWCASEARVGDGTSPTPLVAIGDRIGFYRHWAAERQIVQFILESERLRATVHPRMETYISKDKDGDNAGNLMAFIFSRRVSCVTGGPGTGKSTLIAKLVQHYTAQFPERASGIQLAAPTARAAQRLLDLRSSSLDLVALPEPITVHRLLNRPPFSRSRVASSATACLGDLLIIDEASMLSTSLLVAVLDALPEGTRLILVGDGKQLPAIEVGGAFQGLVEAFKPKGNAPNVQKTVSSNVAPLQEPLEALRVEAPEIDRLPGICGPVMTLRRPHRFGPNSPLDRLAQAILSGDEQAVLKQCLEGSNDSITWIDAKNSEPMHLNLLEGYRPFFESILEKSSSPAGAWKAFSEFRCLVAQREGARGADAINQWLEDTLLKFLKGSDRGNPHTDLRRGLPLMVRRNMPALGLSNGDVGLCWNPEPDNPDNREAPCNAERLKIWFPPSPSRASSFIALEAIGIPHLQRAFATTVHKAQGSEFKCVWIILPEEESTLVSRSWLYTAVTRAQEGVVLFASESGLCQAVGREAPYSNFFDLLL